MPASNLKHPRVISSGWVTILPPNISTGKNPPRLSQIKLSSDGSSISMPLGAHWRCWARAPGWVCLILFDLKVAHPLSTGTYLILRKIRHSPTFYPNGPILVCWNSLVFAQPEDKDGSGSIDTEEFVPLLTRVLKRPGNSMDKIPGKHRVITEWMAR